VAQGVPDDLRFIKLATSTTRLKCPNYRMLAVCEQMPACQVLLADCEALYEAAQARISRRWSRASCG